MRAAKMYKNIKFFDIRCVLSNFKCTKTRFRRVERSDREMIGYWTSRGRVDRWSSCIRHNSTGRLSHGLLPYTHRFESHAHNTIS